MSDSKAVDKDQQVKKVKRLLEGWRMALVPLKSVLIWEQQWHPAAILATVTALHLIIWLLDLNFLTTIAVVGLIVNFVDFIVPVVCNSLCSASAWTGQKEKVFDDICRSIVASYNQILGYVASFCSLREGSPCMYYVISISMLCIIAWLSSTINNIFLLYVLSTTTLLWPGVQHRGIFNTVLAMLTKAPNTLKSE